MKLGARSFLLVSQVNAVAQAKPSFPDIQGLKQGGGREMKWLGFGLVPVRSASGTGRSLVCYATTAAPKFNVKILEIFESFFHDTVVMKIVSKRY